MHDPTPFPASAGRPEVASGPSGTTAAGGAGAGEAAALRDAAEEASALGHAPVAPDATAAYGEHPDQVVDFYRPGDAAQGRPGPLVVFFHGGAWRAAYDRRHVSPLAAFLARRGFAVASVEYRRGNGGPVAGRWPDTFDDVAAAVDAVPGLAVAALGAPAVDARRIVLAGHSAGGHLALWAAARHVLPPRSRWYRPAPAPLRGVVALAPLADFATAVELDVCSGAVTELLGGAEQLALRGPETDPAALLPTGIPVTVVQGSADTVVPSLVAEAFVTATAKAGEEAQLTLLADVGHFPVIDPDADAAAVVAEEIAQLAW